MKFAKNIFFSCTLFLSTFCQTTYAGLLVDVAKQGTINKTVFKVFGAGSPGSGVLVIMPDSKTAILTSKHVLKGLGKNEEIEVQFTEDKSIFIKRLDSKDIPGTDLSIINIDRSTLERDDSFQFVGAMLKISNISIGEEIFTSGYPISNKSISKSIRSTTGNIQTIEKKMSKDGYDIGYSSKTYVGMSGGGVFGKDGKLIAIHGRGEAIESGDVNKTGTNYAVSVLKIVDFYRNNYMKKNNKNIDFIKASREIIFKDFKKARKSWRNISNKYPESIVARYNADCLDEIVVGKKINKGRHPELFNNDTYYPSMKNYSDWEEKKGSLYAYMNDPIVKKYRAKYNPSLYDTELQAAFNYMPIWASEISSILTAVQDPSHSYTWEDWDEKCHLLTLKKQNKPSYWDLPFVPVYTLHDQERP